MSSTRVDEGRKCRVILAIKKNARAVMAGWEKGPLCDPGSYLLLGGSARLVR